MDTEIELLDKRAMMWRYHIELFKTAHKHRFPGRRSFSADLELFFVYGAATVLIAAKKPVRPASIGRLLHMPKETARRNIATLRDLGILVRTDHTYTLGERGRAKPNPKLFSLLLEACSKLV